MIKPPATKANLFIIIIIIIIIINLFIEGIALSVLALLCLRALFGATWIHSYRRMASLIRTRLSDLCTRREVGTFGEETLVVQLYPRMKTFLLMSGQAWNHRRTTSCGVNID